VDKKHRDDTARTVRELGIDLPETLRSPEPGTTAAAILEAARGLFAESGFAGTSTRSIADAAGVNVAMIHYYFGNKEQLYRRVAELEIVDLFRIIREGVRDDTAAHEVLLALPGFVLQLHQEHPELMRLILREMSDGAARLEPIVAEMGVRGPRGLQQSLKRVVAVAKRDGYDAGIPTLHLLAILFSIGNGLRAFQPLLAAILGLDLTDPATTAAVGRSVQRLLRRALTPAEEN
jgi:TetR/AcrR family transcriptional regulator